METTTDRVTRYLLARIRRHSVLDLYRNAADAGLLEERFVEDDEHRGTVWTVVDNARHLLTGDPEKDRSLIARCLRRSVAASGGTTLNMFDYENDQDAELEVRPRTKSRVKHIAESDNMVRGHEARPATLPPGQPTMAGTKDILAMVRQHVPAPNVAHVTVALLVARAVGSSIADIAALRRLMSCPDLFALIKAPVRGFERRFTQTLEDGLLLPYPAKVGDVYHGATLREQRHGQPRAKHRRRHVKLLSGNRARHIEHTVLSRHLGDALLDRTSPVIVVDETSIAPPPSLAMTADVVFECSGLDNTLLAELLHIILGIAPTRSLKRMEAAALDLEGLSIDDMTLAIRPSHNLETTLTTLAALADRVRNRDEDDSKDSDGRHTRTSRDLRSKSRTGTSGETGKAAASLDGVEIIHPLKPTTEKTAAVSEEAAPDETVVGRHLQQLRIETLSGYGEAEQWALDLKVDLELWRDGDLGWSDMSTKLLLSGPPGTGKTTYARALCNTLHVPLLVTSVAAWLEPGYLGDVLKRMSHAFEAARAHAPSILFIDEIDNIGSGASSTTTTGAP
jgi:cell division protease FtsH